MIFRRYGTSLQSVDLNFDSKALNEVGFRRNRERAIPVDEFESTFELVERHEIVAEADGNVQDHTEQQLLDKLQEQIEAIVSGMGDGQILFVENEQGHDWPKTKQKTTNVVVQGENKLHFDYTIAPPIRVSVHRPGG